MTAVVSAVDDRHDRYVKQLRIQVIRYVYQYFLCPAAAQRVNDEENASLLHRYRPVFFAIEAKVQKNMRMSRLKLAFST